MRPLSFLHISTFYPPFSFGGDAVYLAHLCQALAGRGHHVEVVHCMDSYELLHRGPNPRPQSQDDVTVHALRSAWKWLSPLLSQQTGLPLLKRRALQSILARRRFDVIHFHNISLFGPAVLRLDAGHARALKVYTPHDYWLVCPTSSLYQFNARACRSTRCMACQLHARRPPQWWRSTRQLEKSCRHVDLFLASSPAAARTHFERGFTYPFATLPLFAAPAGEPPPAEPSPHPRPYLLYVGRLENLKGPQTLLSAWRDVPGVDLALAGAGTQDSRLRNMAAGNPRVRFLGQLPPQELSAWRRHALAVVVPTQTYEMFGLVIAEAFAHATPAIVRDIGCMPELIEQTRAGVVYRNDDELKQAVLRLADSPGLRAELASNAFNAWSRDWTPDAHLDRYLSLLEETALRKFGEVPWRT